jgi:hypothetical protein
MKKNYPRLAALSAALFLSALSPLPSPAATATDTEGYTYYDGTASYSGRYISSVTLTGENSNTQTISISQTSSSRKVWQDKVTGITPTVTFAPGETITVTSIGSGIWMHTYFFIDYDGDKTFTPDFESDGYTVTDDSELVSYNLYSLNGDDGPFYNSEGTPDSNNSVKGAIGSAYISGPSPALPSFKLPENLKSGTYRCRYMVAWNSIEANGTGVDKNNKDIATNGGELIDFLIEVAAPVEVVKATVTISYDSSKGTFTVTNTKDNSAVSSGTEVNVGTKLEIFAQPNNKLGNYALQGVFATVDDTKTELLANSSNLYDYEVIGDVTISADFVDQSDYKPLLRAADMTNGTVVFSDADGNEITDYHVASGTVVTITPKPNSDYRTESVSANGTALTANSDGTYTYTVTADTKISATFSEKYPHFEGNITAKTNYETWMSRYLTSITFNGENNNSQTISDELPTSNSSKSRNVWQSKIGLTPTTTFEPGEEITVTSAATGDWLHTYVYIDYNNDGIFTVGYDDAEHKITEDSELVTFNGYSTESGDNATYYDSSANPVAKGYTPIAITSSSYLPTFKLPKNLTAGTYRVRYKIDWNDLDPYGSQVDGSTIAISCGEIVDFLIEVALPTRKVDVTVADTNTDNKYGSVKIKDHGDDTSVESSDNVTVVAEPSTTKKYVEFMGWTLSDDENNTIISTAAEYEYNLAAAANLVAHFGYKVLGKVTGAGKLILSTKSSGYASVGAAKAPALRADDSSEAAETTDNRTLTTRSKDGELEMFEAGTTIYVNAVADDDANGVGAIYVYNKETEELTTYDLTTASERSAVTLAVTLDVPKDVYVKYVDIATGVEDIAVDGDNAEAEYFNLNGVRVTGDLAPGLYIRRTPAKTEKVIVK